ncbi:MAG TPA: CBS domain-containing protein [Desulfobaccales bacterium]|nr:CBS domain-containing protein [Desulfobaccales bacterium]
MANDKKVKDLMISLEDFPHIPYWFTLRQAMAIVREAVGKFAGAFEPRALLVFDEKYQLMGILTLRNMIKGLEPSFLQETSLVAMDPNLSVLLGDLLGPNMRTTSQRPVSEVMCPIQVTVDASAPVAKALYLMIQENVGFLPVMQAGKVAGMIRLSDLFHEVAQVVLGDQP